MFDFPALVRAARPGRLNQNNLFSGADKNMNTLKQ
jgi:hypothetical protein